MKVKISSKIFEKYPEMEIAVVVARNINNKGENPQIQKLIREIEAQTRQELNPEKLLELPSIAKWREIYKSFGAKPSDTRNSAEALIRRILKTELYKINKLVDIYNYISIKYQMTVGGEDISQIKGDLILDFATGNEEFIALGENENQPPKSGEVVYKDNKGVICRCWNWKEADRTKLTENTQNAVIVIENPIPEGKNKLVQASNELSNLLNKYCNADCKVFYLTKNKHEIEI